MMTPQPHELAAEWNSADVADESTWTEIFGPSELDEIETALRNKNVSPDHPGPSVAGILSTI